MHEVGMAVQKSAETRIVEMIENMIGYISTSYLSHPHCIYV